MSSGVERKAVFAIAAAKAQLHGELDSFGVTAKIGDHLYDSVDAARAAFHSA